ncbi:hypothetical protein EGR_02117 [Echinococcus granulosus]|uniref:Uncharacterized protein n=1 Tax=Echinococcus granulosus TaxID=6210 RepID=W6UP62_ECHGR|nr:hypothetical protein EGR_02117 [Echinococcus granulosus]EUB63023.1 hypothetical protein EGR_02117 [Echinococcus granulosus]
MGYSAKSHLYENCNCKNEAKNISMSDGQMNKHIMPFINPRIVQQTDYVSIVINSQQAHIYRNCYNNNQALHDLNEKRNYGLSDDQVIPELNCLHKELCQ